MRKTWKKWMMIILVIGTFWGMSLVSSAAAGDIAGGVIDESYGQITWRIDKNGHLTVEGWGDLTNPNVQRNEWSIPWHNYASKILSAKIDVTGMKNASYLFYDCTRMKKIDIRCLATGGVRNMQRMFAWCEKLEKIDASKFDTSSVTTMEGMFMACRSLKELDVSHFDTHNVVNMRSMFNGCILLKELDVSHFDTSNVDNMGGMFDGCRSLKELDVSHFDTRNVEEMYYMFAGCENLKKLDLSSFDTSNVDHMYAMFYNCKNLQKLDLSSFDTSNVVYMADMFAGCWRLRELNVSSLRTSKVEDMRCMFQDCANLTYLDLSKFEINGRFDYLLTGCWKLEQLETPKKILLEEKKLEFPGYQSQSWYNLEGEDTPYVTAEHDGSITVVKIENNDFRDVYDDWYTPYVEYVFQKGLMKGYDQFFSPNDSMTRGMVVQTLYNMENKPAVTDYKACEELKDVYRDWYTDAVCWAYNEGITTGYDDTKTFEVNQFVTREELATFLYRYAKYKQYDTGQTENLSGYVIFVSPYAKDAVIWAVGAGIIRGMDEDGRKDLALQGNATRAQMAAILMRFCEVYELQLPDKDNRIPEDVFEWNGHFYKIFDNVPTYELAKVFCEAKGGHLAVITSQEENEALYAYIKEKGYTSAYFGLSDKAEEGTWTWVNVETTDYTNWNADEPGGGTDENYAMFFYLYEDGAWNDGAFSENVYDGGNAYICEWETVQEDKNM